MSLSEKIREIFGELYNEFKRILDEIERGCYKRQIDVFDDFVSEVSSSETKLLAVVNEYNFIPKEEWEEIVKVLKNIQNKVAELTAISTKKETQRK